MESKKPTVFPNPARIYELLLKNDDTLVNGKRGIESWIKEDLRDRGSECCLINAVKGELCNRDEEGSNVQSSHRSRAAADKPSDDPKQG
jgi:hypothetical protein